MYKLPQLPHDQFAAFVCALFEQLLDDDFTLNEDGKLIESTSGEMTILAVPLSIEQFQKEAIQKLKEETANLLSENNNDTKGALIVATNYALELNFQDHLDDLNLGVNCVYLDWESLSILADNAFLNLSFLQFYPNLNFKQLPHAFKSTKEAIDYYQKGVSLKSFLFGKDSKFTLSFKIILAETYEHQEKYLEALRVYKEVVPILEKDIESNTGPNDGRFTFIEICQSIGLLYYELGEYNIGINWFSKIYRLIKNNRIVFYQEYLSVIINLTDGYRKTGKHQEALNIFSEVENILINNPQTIPLKKIIILYSLGIGIYDNAEEEEKAFVYFNICWKTTNEIEETKEAKQLLELHYPKYYKKFKNKKHLINTTFSHSLSTKKTPLPFALKQVHIKGFQSIKNLKIDAIPVDAQWIFITGKNGSGKSSILKAIAAGIVGDVIQEHIRPSTEKDCIISIELLQDDMNQIQTLKSEDRRWELYKDKELDVRNIPLLAYGVSRLNIQTEGSEERRYKDDHVFSLFKSDEGNLSNVEEWLKDEMLKILKAKVKKDKIKLEKRYKMVKDTLSKLMPSVSRVDYNDKEAHIEYTENGEVVKMERLASGNKSILAMVGDILIRLLRFYPKAEEKEDFKGIIIIDELDLHLHPSWQRELPWLLSTLFPKIQFICSTHSIIPFMGAPKNSVFFTVDRTEEEGTTIQQLKDIDVSNLSANILLSSPLFDVSLLSKVAEEEGKSQEYRTESDYKEYDKNVKESKEFRDLEKKYGSILGDKLFKK
jgi:predicted ATP-binding protein involved in virulence